MPHYIPFKPGDRVKCAYRVNDTTGHVHEGTVIADDDPRAWAGSIAFPDASPNADDVRAHVARCRARGDLAPGAHQPVLWDFGKVYWDTQLHR